MRSSLAADLGAVAEGVFLEDTASLEAASRDWGGVVRRVPSVLARPADARSAAAVLRWACARGLRVTCRGAAHSQGGQSVTDRICLDLGLLNRVERDGARLTVGGGARWNAAMEHIAGTGLVPPVLTDNPYVTVAGTISTGGFGTTSFRCGCQADTCEAIEVATPSGELLRLQGPGEPGDLYRHALCGLGEFAPITRATLRLEPAPAVLRAHRLLYDTVGAWLEDATEACRDDRALHVSGRLGTDPRLGRVFELHVAVDARTRGDPGFPRALRAERSEIPARAHLELYWSTFKAWRKLAETRVLSHPWVEAFVPWKRAEACVVAALERVPAPWLRAGLFLLWPVRPSRFPMLAQPAGDLCLLVGALPMILGSVHDTLETCRALDGLFADHGAKRYLSGWLDWDREGWERQFGAAWPGLVAAKARFDPEGTLGSGLVRWTGTESSSNQEKRGWTRDG